MSASLFPGRRVMWLPLSIDWAPPSEEAKFCCDAMTSALDFVCSEHADPFACADSLVVYHEIFDEIGLVVHDGGPTYVLIEHCPWCGTKLPESQRDRWFDETEEKGLEDDALPEDYTTGAWRRPK